MPEPITMATVAAVAEAGAAAGEGAAAAVGAAGPAEVGGHLAAVGEAARSASVGGTTEAFVGTLKMDASAVGEAMLTSSGSIGVGAVRGAGQVNEPGAWSVRPRARRGDPGERPSLRCGTMD